MDIYSAISSTIALLLGSGVTALFTIRWARKKESGLAKQEIQRGDELEIANTKELISMYKDALEYRTEIWNQEKESFNTKINNLSKEVSQLNDLIKEYAAKLSKQDETIRLNELTIKSLKEELESIKISSRMCHKFDDCKYRLEI